jgi:Ca2+-binding RTX toxin-like protein
MTGATEGAAGLAATALPPDHAPVLRPDVDHRAADPGGYPGKNVIFGTPGDDVLLGGDGDDVFHPGTGNKILVGGAGSDTADFSDLPEPIIANLLAYSDSSGVVDTDHWTNDLIGVENVIGTAYDDDLNGNPQENELDGMGGDDYLAGLEGDDRLFGGDGSDVISGGSGADLIDGGPGWDLVTYFQNWNQPEGVTVNLATGTADDGFGCFDTLVGIEGIRGSGFGDVLIGDAGDNRIDGSYGNDEIHGGNSILRDTLVGGPGTDTFFLELSQGGYQEILDFEPGEHIVAEGAAAGESANYLDLVATMDGNVQVVNAATHVMVGLIVGGAVMGLDESIFG